jgi:hypothetical protein
MASLPEAPRYRRSLGLSLLWFSNRGPRLVLGHEAAGIEKDAFSPARGTRLR